MANTNYTNNKDRVPTGKYQKKNYDLELASDSEYRMKDESTKQVTIETMSSKVTIPAKLDVDVTSIDLDDDLKQFMVETALDIGTNDLPFDFVLTSGLEGRHAPGSKHYSGRAIDIRISDKYRGYNEGVDTPWDDPVYKYFYEGKGKILLERYNIDLLDNLRHGDAPHLHLETEDGEGGYDNSDIKTQSDYMMDGEVDRLQKQQEDLLRFTTEINNETQKVEDKAEEVDTNPALDYLQRQQEYRQMMTDLITDYSENMLTETPKDTPIQQSPGAYTPNQIVTTRFQTLEQATGRQQFADGGEKSQPWAGRSFDRPEPYEMSQDEIIGMKQHALGMSLTDIPEFWDKFNAKKSAQEEKYKQWETEAERSRFDKTFEVKQTPEGLESKYSLPELKVEGKISKPDYKDPSGNNWKNWDKLTPEEQMIVKNNAGENQYQLIRLQQKAGYDEGEWVERGGDAMMATPITMAKGVVQPLQVAQTLLVESVEAMRGNDYDFNRANPFSYKNVSSWNVGLEDIRTPSQVWLPEDAPEELKFVLDVVADPSNLAGGAGLVRNLATKGTKAAVKSLGKTAVKGVDNIFTTTTKKGASTLTEGFTAIKNVPKELKEGIQSTIKGSKIRNKIYEELSHPEISKRLSELGAPPIRKKDVPRVTVREHEYGSHYSPGEGTNLFGRTKDVINIDELQLEDLIDLGLNKNSVISHETAHFLQEYIKRNANKHLEKLYAKSRLKDNFLKTTESSIDKELLKLKPKQDIETMFSTLKDSPDLEKKVLNEVSKRKDVNPYNNYKYFNEMYGSDKLEPFGFLREFRQGMVDKGIIDNITDPITEAHLRSYNELVPENRIGSFMDDTKENYKILTQAMNKAPIVTGAIGIGTAGYMSNLDNGTQ